jgi:hypothetical protein
MILVMAMIDEILKGFNSGCTTTPFEVGMRN